MAIHLKTIDQIQRAGEALSTAKDALTQDVQASTAALTQVILAQAGADVDRAFAALKEAARLAHEMAALEERLKDVYLAVVALVERPQRRGRQTLEAAVVNVPALPAALGDAGDVEDAVEKPPRRARLQRRPAVKAVKAVKAPRVAAPGGTANQQKVMAYLKTRLTRRGFRAVTVRDVALGSGVPLGSVGSVLRQLVAAGALQAGERSQYRLV